MLADAHSATVAPTGALCVSCQKVDSCVTYGMTVVHTPQRGSTAGVLRAVTAYTSQPVQIQYSHSVHVAAVVKKLLAAAGFSTVCRPVAVHTACTCCLPLCCMHAICA